MKKAERKQKIKDKILKIFHNNHGTPGYRMMTDELEKESIYLSSNTVYSYMKELGLKSVTRRKYYYHKGEAHKVFANLLERDFTASKPNEKWCTDFTYLHLSTGEKRYNCAILDLYDRSIVASITSDKINSDLAINTLKQAFKKTKRTNKIILHSDQGSQYTSKKFTEFCSQNNIIQSMSKAGCPYDNAPMERFYNTLKCEFYYLFNFNSDNVLKTCINDFIFTRYNFSRPHSFNNGLSPMQKRLSFKLA
jgi:transposase InsO family protein